MKRDVYLRMSALGAALLLFSGLPKAAAVQFSDVPQSYWANREISYVVDKGLFNGTSDTAFSPEVPMKRGQLAAVLYRYAGSPEATGENFDDVDPNSYYADACLWARHNGIFMLEKYTGPILKPDEAISRSEFATMLYNFSKLDGRWATKEPVKGYKDMQSASDEIKESMLAWAVPNGIMNGTSATTMNPYGGIKRAHVAAMLYRYEQLPKGEPLPEEEPEAPVKKDVYGAGDHIPFEGGHYKAQIAVGEKIYVGAFSLGCDDEYMVDKRMGMEGLHAVGKVPGKTTLTVPEEGNPSNDRWITVELTITEKPGAPVEKPVAPEKPVTPEKPANDADFREIREEIVRLTNAERAKEGLAPLEIDEQMMEAAQIRANEMLKSYSHIRPDGRKCSTIFDDLGIPHSSTGENGSARQASSASVYVDAWMRSPGHKDNILTNDFVKIGVGLIKDAPSGEMRCVQLFATR